MKKKNTFWFHKPAFAVAALALCICVTVATAIHYGGFFKDITGWNGAVVGTMYKQATDEIEVQTAVHQEELLISVTLLTPDTAPYRDMETLGLGDYQIVDPFGTVITAGEGVQQAMLTDGTVELRLNLNGMDSGSYTLMISSFIGGKKADQPLPINGNWECVFTV